MPTCTSKYECGCMYVCVGVCALVCAYIRHAFIEQTLNFMSVTVRPSQTNSEV